MAERFADLALRGELSANLVGFCRRLRQGGLNLGPAEQRDALLALERIDLGDGEAFRLALRTALAKSSREQEVFDQLFPAYWQVWERAGELNRPDPGETPRTPARQGRGFVTLEDWLKKGAPAAGEEEAAGYSPFEARTRKDFSHFREGGEQEEMARLLAAIARALATRLSRRFRPDQGRGRPDLRRTLRRNLHRGGELLELLCRRRPRRKLKLVLLCDVSRSMDLYSRFLIRFLCAFQQICRRLETFAFSTALHRITPALREEEPDRVLEALARAVPEWSGGTRIGASLQAFLSQYGKELVDRDTVVLILSDGWDTGALEVLEGCMAELRRRSHCLIWLNPLMGNPEYRPASRGMQVALPFIDVLAPAHNLESLRRLAGQLARIQKQGGRPRQKPLFPLPEPPLPAPLPVEPEVDVQAWLRRFGRA